MRPLKMSLSKSRVVGRINKMKAVVTDKGFKIFMESTWRY
jgi:hypothetical protein